jgi:quinol monooxygenase YgiN
MTVIIAGTMRVPPEQVEALKPHMAEVMAETRKEEGNIDYAFSFDASDPGLVRLFEKWTDAAKLGPHSKSAHIAKYREACAGFAMTDRAYTIYEVAGEKPLG